MQSLCYYEFLNFMIVKKILFLFICFFTFLNTSFAEKYRLLGDPDYYFDVNRNKFLYNDKFDNVSKQINNQYKGELNIKHRRPEFDLYEYDFTFLFGYSYGQVFKNNVSTLNSIDYRKKYSANIGLGLVWSNNYKLEFEFLENKNRDISQGIETDYDIYLLTGTIDYYRYQASLRPYMSLSIGSMHTKATIPSLNINKSKEFSPFVIGGALGLEYYFLDASTSIYVQARYLRSLTDAKFSNSTNISYDYFGIGFGVRVYIN